MIEASKVEEAAAAVDDFGKPGFDLDAHFAKLMAKFDAEEVVTVPSRKSRYDDDAKKHGVDEHKGDDSDGGQFDDADDDDDEGELDACGSELMCLLVAPVCGCWVHCRLQKMGTKRTTMTKRRRTRMTVWLIHARSRSFVSNAR